MCHSLHTRRITPWVLQTWITSFQESKDLQYINPSCSENSAHAIGAPSTCAPSSRPCQACCLERILLNKVHAVSHTMPCASASTGLKPRSNAHRDPATRQSPAPLVLTATACGAAMCSTSSHRPSPLQPQEYASYITCDLVTSRSPEEASTCCRTALCCGIISSGEWQPAMQVVGRCRVNNLSMGFC